MFENDMFLKWFGRKSSYLETVRDFCLTRCRRKLAIILR